MFGPVNLSPPEYFNAPQEVLFSFENVEANKVCIPSYPKAISVYGKPTFTWLLSTDIYSDISQVLKLVE